MSDKKKTGEKEQETARGGWISRIFSRNGFTLAFSVIVAVVVWLAMSYTRNTEDTPWVIRDIPITVNLSEQALSDGLKIFSKTQETADISIRGSSSITSRLTAGDFEITGEFSPASTKVSGSGLRSATILLKAVKKNNLTDYSVERIDPEEITVEYDRAKETVFPIEPKIVRTTETGYVAGEAVLSEANVTISGPESSVNKISGVSAAYELADPLKEERTFSCALTLYGQDDKPITDYSGMYLTLSTETIEVTVPVYAKKTVPVVPTLINRPAGLADSRITVTPPTIDIAASPEDLASIEEIALETPIDFTEVTLTNREFTMDLPLPQGVTNLSDPDDTQKVTVSINLNSYKEAKLTTTNITLNNVPAGISADAITKSLTVTVIGSEAQIGKLTGESISVVADMANVSGSTGSVQVPVTITISNASSCWAVGKYTVNVNITAGTTNAAVKILEDDPQDNA